MKLNVSVICGLLLVCCVSCNFLSDLDSWLKSRVKHNKDMHVLEFQIESSCNLEYVQRYILSGGDINTCASDSLLVLSIINNCTNIFDFLLLKKADVNYQCFLKKPPLFVAV